MLARVVLSLLVLSLPAVGYGQAYKCRTESGKVVITNQGCSGGATLEKITKADPVTFERQLQAGEVNSRMIKQLDGIAREQMVSNAMLQRQQALQAQQDANQRVVMQQQAAEMARAEAAAKNANCIATATSRRNSSMLAECEGRPNVQDRKNPWDEPDTPPPPEAKPAPMGRIKSCVGNSCRDTSGENYTVSAGKVRRNSDGASCQQRGNYFRCN